MAYIASYAVTAGSGTVAVTAPSGIVAGDLILVYISITSSGALSITPAAGFTQVTNDSGSTGGGSLGGTLYAKTAGASEPGTYSFTTSTGNANYVAVRVSNWNGSYALGDFKSGNFSGSASTTSTPYTVASFSLSRVNNLVIVFASQLSGDVTPTASGQVFTQLVNNTTSPPLSVYSTPTTAITTFPTTTLTPTVGVFHQANAAIILAVEGLNIAPTPLVLTSSMNPAAFRRLIQAASLVLTSVMSSATASEVANKWKNATKHAASWLNATKH